MPTLSSMFATTEMIQRRLATCGACPHLSGIKVCTQCGCIVPLKVRLRGSECPLQFWTSEVDDGEIHEVADELWSSPASDSSDHK